MHIVDDWLQCLVYIERRITDAYSRCLAAMFSIYIERGG